MGAAVAWPEERDGEPGGEQRLDLLCDIVAACPFGEVAEPCKDGGASSLRLSQQVCAGSGAVCVGEPIVGVAPTALRRRTLGSGALCWRKGAVWYQPVVL